VKSSLLSIPIAFAICLPTSAQDLEVIVEPTQRTTTKIVLVIDVSGSMEGERITNATAAALMILEQPADEYDISIIVFAQSMTRWPGYTEEGDEPNGWAHFPSLEALNSANEFIHSFAGSGGTFPGPAIESAFQESVDPLTIVLITDGEFPYDIERRIQSFQAKRLQRENQAAVFAIIGLGRAGEKSKLRRAAEIGGGGFYAEPIPVPRHAGPLGWPH